jgi:chloramphenicol-sensitive protein RarD
MHELAPAGPRVERSSQQQRDLGLLCGVAAYGLWGLFPIYFKAIRSVPPVEILAHRVLWALAFFLVLVRWQGLRGELSRAVGTRGTLITLAASALLIASNWLLYIWAVLNERVMEGSLGYFINPLVNVLLGVVLLKERLSRAAVAAIAIAAAGVAWLTIQSGAPPWIALGLAFSFGSYGMLRKIVPVGAIVGLTVEAMLLAPLAAGYLVWARTEGRLAFLAGAVSRDLLLMGGGPLTAVPLLLFTAAARRLPLSTVGFLQYISPSIQFLLAVALYGEPFTSARKVAFACIWTGLAIFAATYSRRRLIAAPPE